MQTAFDQEKAVLAQRGGFAGPTGGMAQGGLQPPSGAASSPMGGAQQPPGAGPAQQGQPTPGFPEALKTMGNILMQGNEADMRLFAAFMGQLDAMVKDHGQGQGQTAPLPQQGIPSTP